MLQDQTFSNLTGDEVLAQLANMVAEKLGINKAIVPETKHITFADARKELGCSENTLTRRIAASGIRTYRWGKGKAFDRKHLFKLTG